MQTPHGGLTVKFMKSKKALLAVAISFVISGHSIADSNIIEDESNETNVSDVFYQKKEKLRLKQLSLQLAEVEKQIREIESDGNQDEIDAELEKRDIEWENKLADIEDSYISEINMLKGELSGIKEKSKREMDEKDREDNLDNVFVTRIVGFGANKRATIYIDNSIRVRTAGEEIGYGIHIVRINKDNIVVRNKDEERKVTITTVDRARSRSFDSSNQGRNDNHDMNNIFNQGAPQGSPARIIQGGPTGLEQLEMPRFSK